MVRVIESKNYDLNEYIDDCLKDIFWNERTYPDADIDRIEDIYSRVLEYVVHKYKNYGLRWFIDEFLNSSIESGIRFGFSEYNLKKAISNLKNNHPIFKESRVGK